jgi:hypothetical protein
MFDPPFEKWERSCLCRTPLNPDQLYIKCDKCEKWYHPLCCNLDENDAANLSEFYCKFCKD